LRYATDRNQKRQQQDKYRPFRHSMDVGFPLHGFVAARTS
jgi:hypothetical protein